MRSVPNPRFTCCFTGYRPEKLPWGLDEQDEHCIRLKDKIYNVAEAVYNVGIRHYICGMARGSDTYFAEAVITLRDNYGGITLEAAIPCETQAQSWPESDKSRYYYLVQQCDSETFIKREYTQDCMLLRNRYMVDNSSLLIAVYDGQFGGTMQTIRYAEKNNLEIIHITP